MLDRLSEVHHYWFGESDDDLLVIAQKGKLWFGKAPLVDSYIASHFVTLIDEVAAQPAASFGLSPAQRLATILLFDQFTRNIYRDNPRCFAFDHLALARAQQLLLHAEELRPVERVFLYLPFEHSENLAHQQQSVDLYRELLTLVPVQWQEAFQGFYDYALRHYDIIAEFGRFPHRNSLLQRASTSQEEAFLKLPGSSF